MVAYIMRQTTYCARMHKREEIWGREWPIDLSIYGTRPLRRVGPNVVQYESNRVSVFRCIFLCRCLSFEGFFLR